MSALGPMAGPPPAMLPLPPGLAGPGGPGPGGPPPGPGGPEDDSPHEAQAETIARKAALAALHHWLQVESDPGDRAMIAKLVASAEKVDADNQQALHDAIGMPPALKAAMQAGPGAMAGPR